MATTEGTMTVHLSVRRRTAYPLLYALGFVVAWAFPSKAESAARFVFRHGVRTRAEARLVPAD